MSERYFSPFWLLLAVVAYVALLVTVGAWAERRARRAPESPGHAWTYALSLTVYCTSWTYFGSVGSAANSGMLYATIYLGPTLVMLLAWELVRRMIRLRQRYRLSSVVDLITQRYGQSLAMGAFITLVLLLGMVPYVGLQLRALVESFTVITGLVHDHSHGSPWHYSDELMVALVGVLTVIFGLRRVDTRERQHGLIAVLAVEAIVKLVAFVAVGSFVTWGLFDGFADLWARLQIEPALRERFVEAPLQGSAYLTWMTYLILAMAAVLFLPRMFHVMIVGNHDERHLLTAMWSFPLYLLLMSFFVLPIAVAGLLLGYPLSAADWLVIRLPFERGSSGLTLLAYLGGLSAALGMVMVACTTMAIMFSNHLVLPLLDRLATGHQLRSGLRPIRWAVVFLMLAAAYRFQAGLANSYLLIQMGLISFAAVLQFVPAGIGGLYWTRGSRRGAWWGLALGWASWAYTLLLPAVVRSGGGEAAWLELGPWGVAGLRPEALFGLDLGSPYPNSVFWTLLFNTTGYVLGSLLDRQTPAELAQARAYTHPFGKQRLSGGDIASDLQIDGARARRQVDELFSRYLPADEAALAIARVQPDALPDDQPLSAGAYLEVAARAERILAGTIGAAMARRAASEVLRLSATETAGLQNALTEQLAELHITPQQLREQVDYFRSLQEVSQAHARLMGEQVAALETAARERDHADAARRESEQRFRLLADRAPVMIWMSDSGAGNCYFNLAWQRFVGAASAGEPGEGWTRGIHPEDRARALALVDSVAAHDDGVEQLLRWRRADGEYRQLRVRVLARRGEDGSILGIVGSAVDISDLLAAEETLRRSNDELEQLVGERTGELQTSYRALAREKTWSDDLIRLAPTLIIGLGRSGEISLFNDYAEQLTGYSRSEVIGKRWTELFVRPAHRQAITAMIANAVATGDNLPAGENVLVVRDGAQRVIEWRSQVMKEDGGEIWMLLSFGVDVTDRRRAQDELQKNYRQLQRLNERLEEAQSQLLQSEKLASIGQLAAGVAHEINNPIGFVSSNLQTLNTYSQQMLQLISAYQAAEAKIGDGGTLAGLAEMKQVLDLDFLQQDLPALLEESKEGLGRVRKIVSDLKDFSHVSEAEWQFADLNAGLDSTLNVVWNEVKYKAQVAKHYGALPAVECLAGQLNQVFMNLIINAVHALDESRGMGTITLVTGHQDGWVWVEVRDNGRGMSDEVKRRLFEPFFTTKPVGQGTGLGMSLSYNIVRKHDGRIEVDSVLGEGTCFRVWLPLTHQRSKMLQ